ncbi:MAG: N-acetylmuramic acid 6-phosphate etherase [Elusimicrobiota bacterium]|jgi:N-acetylmuramic acid 6-phosphate etherase
MPSRYAFYGRLPTEQSNPASRGLDLKSTRQIVALLNRQDLLVPRAVARVRGALVKAADAAAEALRRGRGLVMVGAGTSGRMGVLEAAECPPTFGTPRGLIRAVMAGGRSSVFRAREGAEDDPKDGARQLRRVARRGDLVIGIAASGITPFVRGALGAARGLGCRTVLVTSNFRTPVPEAEIVVAPDVGPESLSGSTRMKSGTAAKLVLNTITTAAMVRIGKAYDNWMVDLRPTSYKLRLRGIRIVGHLVGVGPARAAALFDASGGHVKTAVVMGRLRLDRSAARRRIRAAGGRLRDALEAGLSPSGTPQDPAGRSERSTSAARASRTARVEKGLRAALEAGRKEGGR